MLTPLSCGGCRRRILERHMLSRAKQAAADRNIANLTVAYSQLCESVIFQLWLNPKLSRMIWIISLIIKRSLSLSLLQRGLAELTEVARVRRLEELADVARDLIRKLQIENDLECGQVSF